MLVRVGATAKTVFNSRAIYHLLPLPAREQLREHPGCAAAHARNGVPQEPAATEQPAHRRPAGVQRAGRAARRRGTDGRSGRPRTAAGLVRRGVAGVTAARPAGGGTGDADCDDDDDGTAGHPRRYKRRQRPLQKGTTVRLDVQHRLPGHRWRCVPCGAHRRPPEHCQADAPGAHPVLSRSATVRGRAARPRHRIVLGENREYRGHQAKQPPKT